MSGPRTYPERASLLPEPDVKQFWDELGNKDDNRPKGTPKERQRIMNQCIRIGMHLYESGLDLDPERIKDLIEVDRLMKRGVIVLGSAVVVQDKTDEPTPKPEVKKKPPKLGLARTVYADAGLTKS